MYKKITKKLLFQKDGTIIVKKYLYLLLIFMFSYSGKASDRPEDVIKKAERSFASTGREDQSSVSLALTLAVPSLFSPDLNVISKHGTDTMSSEMFRDEREKCNDHLIHVLNAGISMLSDYLHQSQNDDDLNWTYSIFPILKNGQAMPLDGYEEIKLTGSLVCSVPNTWLCQINRQRNSLDLNTLLGLMVFWKKTIFSTDRSQSYCESNALALKLQIAKQLENRKKTFYENIDNGLSDFGYRESIISILEDLSDTIPNQKTVCSRKTIDLKRKEISKDEEIIKKMNIYNNYWSELNITFLELSRKLIYIYHNPQILLMDTSKILIDSLSIYQKYIKLIYKNGKNNYTGDVLDLNKLLNIENFNTNIPFLEETNLNQDIELLKERPVVIKEETVVDEGKIFSLHVSYPEISKYIYNNIIIHLDKEYLYSLASTNKYYYNFCSTISFSERDETIYDDMYWKSENAFYQQIKNNINSTCSNSMSTKNDNITNYEINLFTFLKDNIFKINIHIKKKDLMKKLSKLSFDVEVNKNGKGSLHYVLPKSNNPLFGNHKGDPEIYFLTNRPYFNIHLPHRNEVIPTGYFLYIQSGFKNVFGLSSDYIEDCLKSHNIKT